jgi:hypothetical protein
MRTHADARQMNRLACLRLTERCADILYGVREEIADAGDMVAAELAAPIAALVECVAGACTARRCKELTRCMCAGASGACTRSCARRRAARS